MTRVRRSVRALVIAACLASTVGVVTSAPASAGTNRWTTAGPAGGDVRSLVFHPNDAARALAGTGGAGVYRTSDGGRSWLRSSRGLHRDASIHDIEYAPTEPATVYAAIDRGAYRSDDGGATWKLVYEWASPTSVAVDPTDADVAFITPSLTVYRTTDRGATWEEIRGPHGIMGVDMIEFVPSDPNRAYAASHATLYESQDSGLTWGVVSYPMLGILDMAVHPTSPERLTVGTRSKGVAQSIDGGETWTAANGGIPRHPGSSLYASIQAVAYDPANPNRIWIGTDRPGYVYRSTDGGATWQAIAIGGRYATISLAASPSDPRRLLVGSQNGGAYRSGDRGTTWAWASAGLVASEVTDLWVRPGRSGTVVAATGGQGIHRSTDSARTWRHAGLGTQHLTSLAGTRSQPDLLYAGGDEGLWRSRDGGTTWRRVRSFAHRGVVDVAVAPSDPRTVYVLKFSDSWRSTDGGTTWRKMSLRGSFGAVEVHPNRPNTVFAGNSGGMHRSDDGGRTWQQGSGLGLHFRVTDIAISASRPKLVYAAGETRGVARSRDGGRTWRVVADGLTSRWVRDVAIDPSHPDRVYAGTLSVESSGGVFVSTNRGASWAPMNAGLTTTWVDALAVSDRGARLYAGTTSSSFAGGGGAFTYLRR